MAQNSPARRSEWWPGARMAELFDWLDRPGFPAWREAERMIRIEEVRDDDTLVIRAEMPGIDPDKDVEVTVRDHRLVLRAERREDTTTEEQGVKRSEFRYGSFSRVVPLPPEAKDDDVTATYKDGVLEVRVPVVSEAVAEEPGRIPVTRG